VSVAPRPIDRRAQRTAAVTRSRRLGCDRCASETVVIRTRDRVSAGQALAGEVLGGPEPVTVSLLRVEQTPSGRRLRACRETIATPASSPSDATTSRARFDLDIPEDAVPSGQGAQCSLSYTLVARSWHSAVAANAWAAIEVVARVQPHVKPRVDLFDRGIAEVPARLFHIELHDAVLAGDGYIAGRVHRNGRCPLGAMMLDVRCTEAWRSRPSWRGAPRQWEERVMWAATAPIQLDDDRRWAPFRCEIPSGLPAATEADTLAWRYDLAVSRRLRHRPDQRATLTPLLFEATSLSA
jgi:hypothetical protein